MGKLSESDKKRLLSNRFVEKITNSHIVFTAEFKIRAVKENLQGKTPIKIFEEAGINSSLFLEEFPKKSIARWKKVFLEKGADGFKEEKRGKGSTGRPKQQRFNSIEEELEYLRLENDFLKKLHALAAEYQKKKSSR